MGSARHTPSDTRMRASRASCVLRGAAGKCKVHPWMKGQTAACLVLGALDLRHRLDLLTARTPPAIRSIRLDKRLLVPAGVRGSTQDEQQSRPMRSAHTRGDSARPRFEQAARRRFEQAARRGQEAPFRQVKLQAPSSLYCSCAVHVRAPCLRRDSWLRSRASWRS